MVDEILAQFYWFRPAEYILRFTPRLRRDKGEAWALTVEDECAIRRSPTNLADRLKSERFTAHSEQAVATSASWWLRDAETSAWHVLLARHRTNATDDDRKRLFEAWGNA